MPILCGSDFSANSADALAAAIALAERRGDRELILVHITGAGDTPPAMDRARSSLAEASQRATTSASTSAMDNAVANVHIRLEVRSGDAAETLADIAAAEKVDLVVVGAGAPNSADRIGTVANRLVEISTVPVLLVRDPAPWVAFGRGEPLKLLAGVDESATGELSLHWLKGLRQIGPVDVTLGAIYYPDEACHKYGLRFGSHVDPDPAVETLLSRDLRHRFEPATGNGAVATRVKPGIGRIGDHLIELATDAKVDVIIVGTRQRTGLGKLGSVSSVVVAAAPQSVICIPPEADVAIQSIPVIRSILVATDLTSFSNRAVPHAFAIAQSSSEAASGGAEVHVLHVMAEQDDSSVESLRARLLELRPRGVSTPISVHVERGDDTSERIAQVAARLGVDVICVASHNRSGIGRALLGSVADRLLRETRLPVTILRPLP